MPPLLVRRRAAVCTDARPRLVGSLRRGAGQKVASRTAKGHKTPCKRASFTARKVAFCTAARNRLAASGIQTDA